MIARGGDGDAEIGGLVFQNTAAVAVAGGDLHWFPLRCLLPAI